MLIRITIFDRILMNRNVLMQALNKIVYKILEWCNFLNYVCNTYVTQSNIYRFTPVERNGTVSVQSNW